MRTEPLREGVAAPLCSAEAEERLEVYVSFIVCSLQKYTRMNSHALTHISSPSLSSYITTITGITRLEKDKITQSIAMKVVLRKISF